jgi:predicted glycoside hydrolase/deacetylase ChbG (UPF0249 family)
MCRHGTIRLTADDAACKDEIDRAILELASLGVLTHVAAFSTYGRLKNFSRLLGANASLGIHFNLSSGRALSHQYLIRSLADDEGSFFCPTPADEKDMHTSLANFLGERVPTYLLSEIEIELTSQLRAFEEDVGHRPDFCTMHHDLDQVPVVKEAMRRVAPFDLGRQALLESGNLIGVFCTFLSRQDNLATSTEKIYSMLSNAVSVSRTHNCALAEIVCHPGFESEYLSDFTVYIKQRELEFKVWSTPEILRVLRTAERSKDGWYVIRG